MSSTTISIPSSAIPRTPDKRAVDQLAQASAESKPAGVITDGNVLPQAEQGAAANQQRLHDAISELKGFVQNIQRNLEFSVDDASGRTVIKVIDSESKEVIREIPPEEVVHLARNLEYSRDGAILKAKA